MGCRNEERKGNYGCRCSIGGVNKKKTAEDGSGKRWRYMEEKRRMIARVEGRERREKGGKSTKREPGNKEGERGEGESIAR